MKVRRIEVGSFLIYPSLLNPIWDVCVILFGIAGLLTQWWSLKKTDKYVEFHIDKKKFISIFCRDILCGFFGSVFNTFWMNRHCANRYTMYLQYKWFPYSGENKEQRAVNVKRSYEIFVEAKAKCWYNTI